MSAINAIITQSERLGSSFCSKFLLVRPMEVSVPSSWEYCKAPALSDGNLAVNMIYIFCFCCRVRDEIRMTIAAYQTLYESRWVQTYKAFIPYGGKLNKMQIKKQFLLSFSLFFLILSS